MLPRRFLSSVAIALSLCCIALPSVNAAPAPAQDELIWRGDHATGRALMDDLAKLYAKDKKGKIVLQPFSTLSGLDAVAQGSADIGGSARGKYARRAEEANVNFVPVALDAAVLITHPKNPVSSLTLKQIHDIYYGRITNWKDLGGEDKAINLYAIATPLDGVEYSLRELVFRNGDQRVAAPRLYINTTKLEEGITLDPAGLGLSTLANAYANKGVKMLGVEGTAPSTATVADGSYPLYITLYLTERVDAPKQAAIDRFVAFLDTPAAKDVLRKHQLTPYSDASAVVAKNEQRMAYIDAQVGRDAAGVAAASMAAATPVSAPRAVLESRKAVAPTAESTEAARANLARAEEKKAAQSVAAASTAKATPAKKPAAVASAPKKKAEAAPAKTAKVAKATAAKPSGAKKAKETAKAAEPAKPASFGNVSGGANNGH